MYSHPYAPMLSRDASSAMMNKKFGRSADIAVAEMVSTNNKNDQRVFMTIPVIDKEWIALPVGQSQNFVGLDCSTPNGETAS